jgi:hypothetical protein
MKKIYLTAKKVDSLLSQKWLYKAVFDFGYQGIAGSNKGRQAEEITAKWYKTKRS